MATLLSGISVLELPGDVATRYCARLFAVLGARVVQVGTFDDVAIGYAGEAGRVYGRWLDQGKIRVEQADDAQDRFDLIIAGQDADAVTKAKRWRAGRPEPPVLLALTWFDASGPYAGWRGNDEVIQALNGVAYAFGTALGPPMLAQGHGPQVTAGVVGFNAALAALLLPCADRPALVEANVFEAAMCFAETGAMTAHADGHRSVRLGINRFVPTYPCSAYPSADGWVGVTCLTPAQWGGLCRVIERPDLAAEPRLATAYERLLAGDEVDALLKPAFLQKTTDAWVALGLAHRIPITAMPTPGQLPQVAHWRSRAAFAPLDGSGVQGPTLPYRMGFDGVTVAPWRGEPWAGPLAGLKVVDFTMGWAGPLCARTLGDLGADVVKIESEGHPDWWRGWEAGAVDPTTREVRHNFFAVNRNKRGVNIDLTGPEGVGQARALVAGADVVIENFAAGVLDKLGLGPDVQRALKPGIISLSMPAFGNAGPLSGTRAYGSTVEQASGMPFVNGEADWPPALQHIALGDPVAGLFAASAVLAALAGRSRLGGAQIDLAQVACLFQLGADAIVAAQLTPDPLPRTGHRRARLGLCTVVAAGEGWLAVAAPDEALAALAQVVGEASEAGLSTWARSLDAADAAMRLQSAGVAAAPVQPPHDLADDPHLIAVGFWDEMERAFVGRHLMAAAPFRFDGKRPALRRPAPTLGEHTVEVLNEYRDQAT